MDKPKKHRAGFVPTGGMRRFADACCTPSVKPTGAARCEAAKVSPATLARWRGRPGFEEWLRSEALRLQPLRAWEVLEMLRRTALAEENVQAAKAFLERCGAPDALTPKPARSFLDLLVMAAKAEAKNGTSGKRESRAPLSAGEGASSAPTDGVPPRPEAQIPCAENPPRAAACKSVRDGAPARGAGTGEAAAAAPSSAVALSREQMWARRMERGARILRKRRAARAAGRKAARAACR